MRLWHLLLSGWVFTLVKLTGRIVKRFFVAYAWIRTRKGGWAIAQSPILGTTVTLKRLQQRGYESMPDYYVKVAPQLNEPLYTRPVPIAIRTVV